jgi:DNA-binding GntR family transcriptional regulator
MDPMIVRRQVDGSIPGPRAGERGRCLAPRGSGRLIEMSNETGYRDNVASHRIADQLRAAILDGSYLPGERIRQEDVAACFGASRIPAREALRMLDAEGLVTLVANSGAWVTKLTLDECVETYLIRERLEPLLLRMSLRHLEDATVDRLAALAADMEAETGVGAFMQADREFHLASYTGAASSSTWQIIHRMWNTTQHYRREFTRRAAGSGLSVTHLEHRLLLDSIRRHDADDAERVLVTHIRRTRLELAGHPEIFSA